MRKRHLCAFLSLFSLAALQAGSAAAGSPESGQRQLSQERWMLSQDGARTTPRSKVRVHFFNPNQVVRVSQRADAAPAVRPTFRRSRPAPARPLIFAAAAARSAPQLAASHEARPQPEIRTGR